jgi:phosphatidylglycerophosphate synthase
MGGAMLGQNRIVPGWVVVLDNAPTVLMFFLGSALIWKVRPLFSALFLLYCILSIFMFWYLICPWCRHFGTSGCPCGYGRISSRIFKRRSGKEFKKVFRQNIGILLPCWVLPLGTGIYLLWIRFSWALLSLFLSFCIVGFILISAISRFVGCRWCTIRDECPWMSQA